MTEKKKIENEKLFKPKTFSFETGLTLSINEDKVLANGEGGIASIDSPHLDNFSYQEDWEYRNTPIIIYARFLGILSLLIILFSLIVFGWSGILVGFLVILLINAIGWIFSIFDAILDLNILNGIVRKFFSNHFYKVTIGNKSGNNISFYTLLDEKNKLIEIEKLMTSLKSLIASKANKTTQQNNETTQNSSNLDELKKLGELYKSGVLTQDEFESKKKELLKQI